MHITSSFVDIPFFYLLMILNRSSKITDHCPHQHLIYRVRLRSVPTPKM